jgi:hypothetical protein
VLLMLALVAHYIIVAIVLVLFVKNTRLTLLGNAWSAFSQMAQSPDVKGYIGEASAKDDATVLKELREGKNGDLRARIVRRKEGIQIAIT